MLLRDINKLAQAIRLGHNQGLKTGLSERDLDVIKPLDLDALPMRCLQSILTRHKVQIVLVKREGPQTYMQTTSTSGRGKMCEHTLQPLYMESYTEDCHIALR